jgi:hypothetical protein
LKKAILKGNREQKDHTFKSEITDFLFLNYTG